MKKAAIVVHSGGMDSSICLAQAIDDYGAKNVLSMSFEYHQRHRNELQQAKKICADWGVEHIILPIPCLTAITENALINHSLPIEQSDNSAPNTLVSGRNGLFIRLAAIHADHLHANVIYTGVIEVEGANSGYRDCSRAYIDLLQTILRIDFDNKDFMIKTPVVFMTKYDTLEYAKKLGVLDYLLENTISCYNGVTKAGCGQCPACDLRNEGLKEFCAKNPYYKSPYSI